MQIFPTVGNLLIRKDGRNSQRRMVLPLDGGVLRREVHSTLDFDSRV